MVTVRAASFRETPLVQPLEHVECAAWDPAWLSLDGTTVRAVPGEEEEYRELYEEWLPGPGSWEGLRLEPPPEPE